MTSEPERIAVTQSAREAAVGLAHEISMSAEEFTSSGADILAQAIAQSEARGRERGLREAAAVAKDYGLFLPPIEQRDNPCPEGIRFWNNTIDNRSPNQGAIATSILALIAKEPKDD